MTPTTTAPPAPPAPPRRRAAARRMAALLPACALVGAAVLAPSGAATAAPAAAGLESPAEAAATWAAGKLTDGTHASGDHGLTADIVMGLAASGTGGDTADKATDWLATGAAQYISRGVEGNVNAGATAKLALVAGIQQRDTADFGGVDLITTLTARLQDSGRFTDDTVSGDMSNQFTQSLAVLALARTGEVPEHAVDFLADTRCADGGYPLSLRSDPTRCNADVDSTGLAVQALLAVGRTVDAEPGLDWLEAKQGSDGGFDYSGSAGSGPNSNSTALAVQALAGGSRTAAADKGTAWLRSVQLGCDAPADERGAVGYQEPVVDGTTLRATAQVIPALAGLPLGEIDRTGTAPDLAEITCDPGGTPGGSSTGTSGDTSSGASGGDDGGTTGDATGGDSGTTGGSSGGDGGTSAGTSGGGDGGAATGGATGGNAPDPASAGGSSGDSGTGGGGGLASTGSGALPLAYGAGLLLLLGTAAVLSPRLRHAFARTGRTTPTDRTS